MTAIKNFRMRIDLEDPLYYGMRKLKIRGRDLKNISDAIFHLMELEVLDLSPERESCLDYKLPGIPSGIGRLVNLRVLMVDTNDLTDLPPEIALLRNLERVALSNNKLSKLPNEFVNLRNLRSVHLANNDFYEFPSQLLKLQDLEFLDLSDNHITVLPENIDNLKKLETLLLFINELSKLPESLCKLTELRCLWVGNNRIRQLPRGFPKLVHLDWGYRYTSSALDGNPLCHPPIEICRMGLEAIDRYMTTYDKKKKSPRK
ncbi:uncharacterized protein LOC126810325 [Patella vulgata]|uniref:uncharacterized protein LOC126810325 n=1 Tax=Patella vulgata TaxID=6465 RepID=UPI00218069F5|nr:uncharacterized protein LOC126810325 [Patella vulgata]